MANDEQFFARGDNGVQLETGESGNTSDGGDIPLTVVSPSLTSAIVYDNSTPNDITEGTVIKFANSVGVYEIRKTNATTVVRGAWQMVFRLRSLPGSISIAGSMRSTAGGNIEMRILSANTIALNANGSTFDTSATALNTSDLYVWDVWIEEGTTTSNGKAKHKLRKINSDGSFTAVHTGTLFTDRNTGIQGTNDFDSWRWGKITSASTMGLNLLEFRKIAGATDYCPDPKTGICGSDQTQEPWTTGVLDAVGLGAWSQVSGTAVTLTGSGQLRTYSVPKSLTGTTLVFGYGGDQCTNTVLPVTDAVRVGGTLVPIRLRTGKSITDNGL
jgi:hypothetical protein